MAVLPFVRLARLQFPSTLFSTLCYSWTASFDGQMFNAVLGWPSRLALYGIRDGRLLYYKAWHLLSVVWLCLGDPNLSEILQGKHTMLWQLRMKILLKPKAVLLVSTLYGRRWQQMWIKICPAVLFLLLRTEGQSL